MEKLLAEYLPILVFLVIAVGMALLILAANWLIAVSYTHLTLPTKA